MSGYQKIIADACGVDETEARMIESVIRNSYPTMDHLTKSFIEDCAKAAQFELQDPELRKLVKEELGL